LLHHEESELNHQEIQLNYSIQETDFLIREFTGLSWGKTVSILLYMRFPLQEIESSPIQRCVLNILVYRRLVLCQGI
jgi:hypothetical protein